MHAKLASIFLFQFVFYFQILFIFGLGLLLGLLRTFSFFFQIHKLKETAAFFGGIFIVLIGWPLTGTCIEVYGFALLFRLATYPILYRQVLINVQQLSGTIINTYIFNSIYSVYFSIYSVYSVLLYICRHGESVGNPYHGQVPTVFCVTVHLLQTVISLSKLGINSNILILAIKG